LGRRYLQTLSPRDALKEVLRHVRPIDDEEEMPPYRAKGRITSRAVFARLSHPPFVCSAMDGYAVNFENTLDADVTKPFSLSIPADAAPVNTGDPLPDTTNAVVMREDTEESENHITIRKALYLWENVRLTGEDIIEKEMLLPANHKIGALDIGMLIAAGTRSVPVKRRPTLRLIPTGKEIMDIFSWDGEDLPRGRLVDFNTYTLMQLAEESGFVASKSDIAIDYNMLRSIVKNDVDRYDVTCIIAGSSAGKEDFTEAIVKELGRLVFHGIAVMPGKPTLFGLVEGKPVFGIPGYPVSAVVSFKTLLEPLAAHLLSIVHEHREVTCRIPYKIPSRIGLDEVVRVNLIKRKRTYYAFPLARGASIFSSIARADGFITVPEDLEGFEEGESRPCTLLTDNRNLEKRIHILGSHDLSLDILRDMVKTKYAGWDLISNHIGSESGILAVQKGISDLATTHVLDEKEKVYNIPVVTKYLPGRHWTLVHIAKRLQGFVVPRDNPKGIMTLADIAQKQAKFVNRQLGSGTRTLLDIMLREERIPKSAIRGYDREESSHTAVGILVRESVADAGMAIYASAAIFGLDFIPLAWEEYDLLVTEEFTKGRRFAMLLKLLRSETFRTRLEGFGGYDAQESGKIKYVNR
jgi:putative molybdopterin biosynthesis protein